MLSTKISLTLITLGVILLLTLGILIPPMGFALLMILGMMLVIIPLLRLLERKM